VGQYSGIGFFQRDPGLPAFPLVIEQRKPMLSVIHILMFGKQFAGRITGCGTAP